MEAALDRDDLATAGDLQRELEKKKKILDGIKVNYLAPVYTARLAHQYLSQTGGHLVFFTSSSYTRGRSGYSLYSSAKAATVNLSQALADPFNKYMTFTTAFLATPRLGGVIGDPHFVERDRMGRLLAFMARLIVDGQEPAARLRALAYPRAFNPRTQAYFWLRLEIVSQLRSRLPSLTKMISKLLKFSVNKASNSKIIFSMMFALL